MRSWRVKLEARLAAANRNARQSEARRQAVMRSQAASLQAKGAVNPHDSGRYDDLTP